ncbi:MAG TPA: hypothetical protein VF290_21410 [Pyrinomonadaceae bacterium]
MEESLKTRLNHYLFLEFGMDDEDEDESRISEEWPFVLREVGQLPERELTVFEFDDGEAWFAIADPALGVCTQAGMTFDDLVLQYSGSDWIVARKPVDLSMSMPGDPHVPSGLERRKALQSLGATVLDGKEPEILEGLYLQTERRYLGLFSAPGDQTAVIGGLPDSSKPEVLFPDASPWRRLAWGIGVWLRNAERA